MRITHYIALFLIHLLGLSLALPVAQDTTDTATLGVCIPLFGGWKELG